MKRPPQPVNLEDFMALAIKLDFPIRGLQAKVVRFLDEQVSRYPTLGKSVRTLTRKIQAVHFQALPSGSRR